MDKKYFLGIYILLIALLFACAPQQPGQAAKAAVPETKEMPVEKVAAPEPKQAPNLKIISPRDGDLIKSSKVAVELKAENFNIVPEEYPVKDNEGHFNVWLDSEKQIGPKTSFTFDNVASGKHSIVAELVKSDQSQLSPRVTQTITVDVESDYVPKPVEPAQGIEEFAVEADDNGFYPDTIQAKVGSKVKINFRFRDNLIYFAGLDVKGPFPTIRYKLKGQQPLAAEFTMDGAARIDSYWPSSGVHKATLNVEVAK